VTDGDVGLLAVVALLIAAATAIFWPLRTVRGTRDPDERDAALENARDAKLGEIRDLELDFRLGKLSQDDYRALNLTLRSEAVEIIREIDWSGEACNRSKPRRRAR
jgi:hypothetical protein